MSRIFITGDKHGNFASKEDYQKIRSFCQAYGTDFDDYMIILGDHGIHYDNSWQDHRCRKHLMKYPITFIMLRGNHDRRPDETWTKIRLDSDAAAGIFWQDPEAENILYPMEFGWYRFAGNWCFVIAGAYSADKPYRLMQQEMGNRNWRWFSDEQLSPEERHVARQLLLAGNRDSYFILSHTCPLRFEPVEMFMPEINQDDVDRSMEEWMDELYDAVDIKPQKWYCGHWHTDKTDSIMRFMYHDIAWLKPAEEAT